MTHTLLGHRIDALVIAYRVTLGERLLGALIAAREAAARFGRSSVRLGYADWSVRRTRAADRFYLECGDARMLVDLMAPGGCPGLSLPGWNVEVTLRATTLARLGLSWSVDTAAAIARTLADTPTHVHDARVRRVDLSADFMNWNLEQTDAYRFVKPGRAKVCDYQITEGIRTYLQSETVTGFTVAAGAPVMARIYDKTAELTAQGDELKRATEERTWRANGWDGESPVTRVEFQLRGQSLDELCRDRGGLRNPDKLRGLVDSVWGYCTKRWLRMVEPGTATRLSRCALDSRWKAVQGVRFVGEQKVAARVRQRGGSTLAGAWGAVVSMLAGRGRMAASHELGLPLHRDETDHAPDWAVEQAIQLTTAYVSNSLRIELRDEAMRAPRPLLGRFLHSIDSAVARFANFVGPPDAQPAYA